jgi:hypothetical protein
MNDETLAGDILRGVPAIAEFTGEGQRQTYALLETGRLPAFKLKGSKIWHARKSTLRKHYEALEGQGGAPDV